VARPYSWFRRGLAAHMNPMLFHHFLDSPERHPHLVPPRSPFSPTVTKKSPLTIAAFVVHYVQGNLASQQLAAAFLPYTELPIKHQRSRSLWNQLLTNCKFSKFFVLTFMQNAGDVGGILNFLTPKPFALSTFCIHPLCFANLAHSFALFCTRAKLNPFLFNRFRTLCQKHPGVGYPCATPARSSGQAAPGFLSPLCKLLLPNVESFGRDLSCV
jgi:hypothetical protein